MHAWSSSRPSSDQPVCGRSILRSGCELCFTYRGQPPTPRPHRVVGHPNIEWSRNGRPAANMAIKPGRRARMPIGFVRVVPQTNQNSECNIVFLYFLQYCKTKENKSNATHTHNPFKPNAKRACVWQLRVKKKTSATHQPHRLLPPLLLPKPRPSSHNNRRLRSVYDFYASRNSSLDFLPTPIRHRRRPSTPAWTTKISATKAGKTSYTVKLAAADAERRVASERNASMLLSCCCGLQPQSATRDTPTSRHF